MSSSSKYCFDYEYTTYFCRNDILSTQNSTFCDIYPYFCNCSDAGSNRIYSLISYLVKKKLDVTISYRANRPSDVDKKIGRISFNNGQQYVFVVSIS